MGRDARLWGAVRAAMGRDQCLLGVLWAAMGPRWAAMVGRDAGRDAPSRPLWITRFHGVHRSSSLPSIREPASLYGCLCAYLVWPL